MAKSKSRLKPGHGRGTGIPSPVDVHVGARLRVRRTLLGMNQTTVGEATSWSAEATVRPATLSPAMTPNSFGPT